MDSVFDENKAYNFDWSYLGDIRTGRENLGPQMPVSVYRLFEYTLRAVLQKNYKKEGCADILREAGRLAGREFCTHLLDSTLPPDQFIAQLSRVFIDMKIGVIRIESFDEKQLKGYMTLGEDLDCSGLPVTGETVCNYDEGFLSGILSCYFKKAVTAVEIDCWAKGDRICRFDIHRE